MFDNILKNYDLEKKNIEKENGKENYFDIKNFSIK
jgi:hypothetical protein